MSNPFTARKPWVAVLMALILGPFFAMLYVGRGALAFAYLALSLGAQLAPLALLPGGVANVSAINLGTIGIWLVAFIGAVHIAYITSDGKARPAKWYARWYVLLAIVVVPALLALTVRTWFYEPFYLPSGSMMPTLKIEDYFFVSKRAYASSLPQRGDVVVFTAPASDGVGASVAGQKLIKRIVGLPGDRVELSLGVLSINGVAVRLRREKDAVDAEEIPPLPVPVQHETLPDGRSYLTVAAGPDAQWSNTAAFTVPPGSYYVLGDNRPNSVDSRMFGPVKRADILGKVVEKFWSKAGGLGLRPVE